MNLANVISRAALNFGGKPAIIFGEQIINYSFLDTAVNRVAAYLFELGIKPGDRVAVYMPNRPEWCAVYYGVMRAGGVAVCLSSSYKHREIDRLLSDSGSRVLVTCDELCAGIVHRDAFSGIQILVLESDPVLSGLFHPADGSSRQDVHVERDKDDVCAILYTGGTTGTPKGAMLTHENIMFTSQNVCYHERTKPEDKSLCFMPLNHVFGGNHIMNSIFYGCGTMVLHKKFDMDAILNSISTHGVTRFYAVPTIYIRMLGNADSRKYVQSITYCFSAATSMASEIVRQWQSNFHLTIHESYGMTETSSLVTFNHRYQHRIGSVGTMAGVVEVRLIDPAGNPVRVGETGEITIRGPNVMKGYHGRPEATAQAFHGDWLRSGDVGRFDQDGYLYIVDRIKDLVISGGLNVYPSEVEDVLYTHPAVAECAVLGLPHREYGEAVSAFVVCKSGIEVTEETLIGLCKSELASYKAPKKIIFVTELPKSPTGKILRRMIRESLPE
jgi:long-chain acyl-CoA synthetase